MCEFLRSRALISGFLLTCASAQQQQRGSREVQDTGSGNGGGRTLLPLPAAASGVWCWHLKIVCSAHTTQRFRKLQRLGAVAGAVGNEQMKALEKEPVLRQRGANPRLVNKQAK